MGCGGSRNTTNLQTAKIKVVIFEAEGGSDKGIDGHRKDSPPIVDSLMKRGVYADILFYRKEWEETLFERLKNYNCYISRVNPGTLEDEPAYFDFLRKLSKAGLMGMNDPDTMISLGSKEVLSKLAVTEFVPSDTVTYYDFETFSSKFPVSLSHGERVLKQNRGSTGNGIWRVQLQDDTKVQPGESIPLETLVKCTEAKDNHVEIQPLGKFITFCNKYVGGLKDNYIVDTKFMPRIKEGELRILIVGHKPINVVKKVPAATKDAFSSTLFSGAKYQYFKPEEFPALIKFFDTHVQTIKSVLKLEQYPLIWTTDFMLDWGKNKEDVFILGEINCSCVGFTSNLGQGIEDLIAEEIIRDVAEKQKI